MSTLPVAADPAFPGRCARCRMPESLCFCAELQRVPCRVRVLVVRHTAEVNKTSNTGRLVFMGLERAEMVDHGRDGHLLDLTGHLGPRPMVLATGATAPSSPPDIDTLVVIDSTWANAKTMRWRIPPLASVPTLSLPPPKRIAVRRLREGRHPEQMATIEAVAEALDLIGDADAAAHLRRLFAAMSDRLWHLRGLPS